MKVLLRFFQIVLVLLIVLFSVGLIFVNKTSIRALPTYTGEIDLKNLTSEVHVYRDDAAIPHIYAQNAEDLYRAVGYTMAQDRLWQMDLLRRATTGTLSEIFGKRMLDTDMLLRALRITQKSQNIMKTLDPEMRLALYAYADGINQYIDELGKDLPPEFTILRYKPAHWEPVHSLNMIGYMSWDLACGYGNEMGLYKLTQAVGSEKANSMLMQDLNHKTAVYSELNTVINDSLLSGSMHRLDELGLVGVFHGSNNWAVNDKKSRDGSAIMCNDMHLGYGAPGIWYQMHCVIENELDVTGIAVPGQPLIVCGHNDDIAWGMTNVSLDDADMYLETLNEDSTEYFLDSAWVPLTAVNEVIKIKGGDVVTKTQLYTHRGPIISQYKNIKNEAISMHWLGNEESNELKGVWGLNRASNWGEFRKAASEFRSISQNICYADVDGNIGLQMVGAVPLRQGTPYTIYPGETSLYDWTGFVPFDENPRVYNPESGYISSANNKITTDEYPHYISIWYDVPYRINSIRRMLDGGSAFTAKDMENMQLDKTNGLYLDMKTRLIAALKDASLDKREKTAYGIVASWDGVNSSKGPAPYIFEAFYRNFFENSVKDDVDSVLYEEILHRSGFVRNFMVNTWHDPESPWLDNASTDTVETLNDVIRLSFKETVAEISDEQGRKPESWNWGKVHTLTLEHALGSVAVLDKVFHFNRGPIELGSNNMAACPYVYRYYAPYVVKHGPSHRHIYTCGDWDNSRTIVPTGTSGIPASDYYCDQSEMFFSGDYRRDVVSKRRVQEEAKFHLVMK